MSPSKLKFKKEFNFEFQFESIHKRGEKRESGTHDVLSMSLRILIYLHGSKSPQKLDLAPRELQFSDVIILSFVLVFGSYRLDPGLTLLFEIPEREENQWG